MADLPPASRPWPRVLLRVFLVLVVALILSGFVYQNISEARDRRFHPMPGQLIDVGSYQMHIFCLGQGSPAVVLDSGLGDSFISWRKVQPEIAKFTRVCSYDRAGTGYSDHSPRPRTSRVMAEELHTLLHKAGIAPPFVLVGHSAAGYNVRVFAGLYRDEVAGIILVDASHPDQQQRFPAALQAMDRSWLHEAEFLEFTMPLGIPRLLGFCDTDPQVRSAECNFNTARGSVEQMKTFRENAAEAAASGSLGDLPLAVLAHDPDLPSPDLPPDLAKPVNDAWEKMQQELAHLSTRGTLTVAKNSGHYIQLHRPDLVIDAVHNVVDEGRTRASAPPGTQ